MKIIILGIQGSGKGTQAHYLATDYGLTHIAAGDLLRTEEKKNTKQGLLIKKQIDKGKLVPDALLYKLLLPLLKKKNYILDGYPRDLAQTAMLEKSTTIDYAIYILLHEQAVYQRLLNRTQCPKCHEPYGPGKPEQQPGTCDTCHIKLQKRADDNRQAISKRIKLFKEETMPVIHYYKKKKKLITVNGNQPPHQLYQDITKKLGLQPKNKLFKA